MTMSSGKAAKAIAGKAEKMHNKQMALIGLTFD